MVYYTAIFLKCKVFLRTCPKDPEKNLNIEKKNKEKAENIRGFRRCRRV